MWQRHLTALDDSALLDPALGGVDTTTRLKTVWQVRSLALALEKPLGDGACGTAFKEFNHAIAPSAVRLSVRTKVEQNNDDPCQVPETSGYKGLENQLYRVEIHELKTNGSAKNWKWSRENGSVVSRLLKIDQSNNQLTVGSLGRDDVLGFAQDQWVEILDDALELEGKPAS